MNIFNHINYALFKLSNKKYIKLIKKLISKDIFLQYLKENKIKFYYLEDICIYNKVCNKLFYIENHKIIFLHHLNLIQFEFTSLPKGLKYLININIKNLQTYNLLKTIETLQKDFLYSNDILQLKYLSHKIILHIYFKKYNNIIVSSNISTIINNTIGLKELVPKKAFVLYNQIKYILYIDNNLTDTQIAMKIQENFKIKIKSKQVFNIRQKYKIPNRKNRKFDMYLQYNNLFSKQLKLNLDNLNNLRNMQSVYELIHNDMTVYIGSTKDLKRRLTQYLNNLGHTKSLREFLINHTVYFRYIEIIDYKYIEKIILEAFYINFYRYPLLNKNRIL